MSWTTTHHSAPVFVADWESVDRNTGRQIDWASVPESYRTGPTYTITSDGGAAIGATSITVLALPVDIPRGTILNFSGVGEFAITTDASAEGDTTIAVEALDAAIEDTDTATFRPYQTAGQKSIPAGTVMAEMADGKVVPREDIPGAEVAIGLLMSTANEISKVDALTGHGLIVGGVIYENLLPHTVTATHKTELDSNGTSWLWLTYADDSEV